MNGLSPEKERLKKEKRRKAIIADGIITVLISVLAGLIILGIIFWGQLNS